MGDAADDIMDRDWDLDVNDDEGFFIKAKYELSSELAHLLTTDTGEQIWIPKSQTLRLVDDGIIITDWLAAQRGLIDPDEDLSFEDDLDD